MVADDGVDTLLRRRVLASLFFFFLGCFFLSSVIPPLTSPDEHDHIERAYLLGKGVLVLDRLDGKSSGGYIDTGLLRYLQAYRPKPGVLSAGEVRAAEGVRWSGQRVYDPSPGTGYYFPVVYFPQAAGLVLGEFFNISVDGSYRLARMFSLWAVVLLLFAAFRLYLPNPLVLSLIVIPMTLFQISSASLDGVSTALAIFSISAFLRISKDGDATSAWVSYAFALAVVVLASSRIHSFPIFILLAASYFYTKNKRVLFLSFASALFVLGWTLFAIKTTVDQRVAIGESTSGIIYFYLFNPDRFFSVVWQTLINTDLQGFYFRSFLGILGWLDSPFPDRYYGYLGAMLAAIAFFSFSLQGVKCDWPQRLLLLFVSLVSIVFILFALLVTWSPHPAQLISGVQGRYFLIPLIVFAYAICGDVGVLGSFRLRAALFLVLVLFVFSIKSSVGLIVDRYYLAKNRIDFVSISFVERGSGMIAGGLLR